MNDLQHVQTHSSQRQPNRIFGVKLCVLNPYEQKWMRKPTMLKKTAFLLLVAGALCLLAFNLIGSTVDAQGVLHEPFGLLPIGFLLIVLGALIYIYQLTKNKWGAGKR